MHVRELALRVLHRPDDQSDAEEHLQEQVVEGDVAQKRKGAVVLGGRFHEEDHVGHVKNGRQEGEDRRQRLAQARDAAAQNQNRDEEPRDGPDSHVDRVEERARVREEDDGEGHRRGHQGRDGERAAQGGLVGHAVRGDDQSDEVEDLQVLVGEVPEGNLEMRERREGGEGKEEEEPGIAHGLEHAVAVLAGDVEEDQREQADAGRLHEETECRELHGS